MSGFASDGKSDAEKNSDITETLSNLQINEKMDNQSVNKKIDIKTGVSCCENTEELSLDMDFIKWNNEAAGTNCFICDKPNTAPVDEDNVCEKCCSQWKYDEEGEKGEGYYKNKNPAAGNASTNDVLYFCECKAECDGEGSYALDKKDTPKTCILNGEPNICDCKCPVCYCSPCSDDEKDDAAASCDNCDIPLERLRDGTEDENSRCNNCYWEEEGTEEEYSKSVILPDYRPEEYLQKTAANFPKRVTTPAFTPIFPYEEYGKVEPPEAKGYILTLWKSPPLNLLNNKDEMISYFQEHFGLIPVIVGMVNDYFFFWLNTKNDKFDVFCSKRLNHGTIRWWEDIYFNGSENNFPEDFRKIYEEYDTQMIKNIKNSSDDADDAAAADDDDDVDNYTIKTKPYPDDYKGYNGNPDYNGPDNYFTDVSPIFTYDGEGIKIDDAYNKMKGLKKKYTVYGFLYPHEAKWANLFNDSRSAKGKKRFKFGITLHRNVMGMSQDYFTNVPPIYKKGSQDKALKKARHILTEKRNLHRHEVEWLRQYNESRVEAGEQPMWEYNPEPRGFKTKIDPVYSKTSTKARARAIYLVSIDRPLFEEEWEWLELYNTSCLAANAPLVEFKEITPRDDNGMPLDYFTRIPPQFTSKSGIAYHRYFYLQRSLRELFPYEKQWVDEFEKSKNSAGDTVLKDLNSDGESDNDNEKFS